eukprot:16450-Pelagococcus_subviridis.AAC.3
MRSVKIPWNIADKPPGETALASSAGSFEASPRRAVSTHASSPRSPRGCARNTAAAQNPKLRSCGLKSSNVIASISSANRSVTRADGTIPSVAYTHSVSVTACASNLAGHASILDSTARKNAALGRYRSDASDHKYCVTSSGSIASTTRSAASSARAMNSAPGSYPDCANDHITITSSRVSTSVKTSFVSDAYPYATFASACGENFDIFRMSASSNASWKVAPGIKLAKSCGLKSRIALAAAASTATIAGIVVVEDALFFLAFVAAFASRASKLISFRSARGCNVATAHAARHNSFGSNPPPSAPPPPPPPPPPPSALARAWSSSAIISSACEEINPPPCSSLEVDASPATRPPKPPSKLSDTSNRARDDDDGAAASRDALAAFARPHKSIENS